MKPGNMIVRFCVLAFAIATPRLFAEGATITLRWEGGISAMLDASLVLPLEEGKLDPEVVSPITAAISASGDVVAKTTEVAGKTAISALSGGSQTFVVSAFRKGLYRLYVTDRHADDDMGTMPYDWSEDVSVLVTMGGKTTEFRPPEGKPGSVWYVFAMAGETGEIIPSNFIAPRKRAVYGYVTDAVSGEPVADADITVTDNTKGVAVTSAKSSPQGKYVLILSKGDYSLSYEKKGFIGSKRTVRFITHEFPVRADVPISPLLLDREYRIVLSWDAEPKDIDSHLTGPMPGLDKGFHISYQDMKTVKGRHSLDRDDKDGMGPETITIRKLDTGKYQYWVHDYTNRKTAGSVKLGYSGAIVQVYREAKMIFESRIRPGLAGTNWKVFELDGATGTVKSVGIME